MLGYRISSPPGSPKRWPLLVSGVALMWSFLGRPPVHAGPELAGAVVQVAQVINRTAARILPTCGGTRWVAENFPKSGAACPRGSGCWPLEEPRFLSRGTGGLSFLSIQ